jgi:hypothetical protein
MSVAEMYHESLSHSDGHRQPAITRRQIGRHLLIF